MRAGLRGSAGDCIPVSPGTFPEGSPWKYGQCRLLGERGIVCSGRVSRREVRSGHSGGQESKLARKTW